MESKTAAPQAPALGYRSQGDSEGVKGGRCSCASGQPHFRPWLRKGEHSPSPNAQSPMERYCCGNLLRDGVNTGACFWVGPLRTWKQGARSSPGCPHLLWRHSYLAAGGTGVSPWKDGGADRMWPFQEPPVPLHNPHWAPGGTSGTPEHRRYSASQDSAGPGILRCVHCKPLSFSLLWRLGKTVRECPLGLDHAIPGRPVTRGKGGGLWGWP